MSGTSVKMGKMKVKHDNTKYIRECKKTPNTSQSKIFFHIIAQQQETQNSIFPVY